MSKASKSHLYKSKIDLSDNVRAEVIEQLNQSLANTFDLWSQIKQAHWNVKGHNFYQLHLLFDLIAGEIYEFIDLVAERITTLGGIAMGTARMAASNSEIPEYSTATIDGLSHIHALNERLAIYAKHVREGIDKCDELDDKDTSDLYTQISRTVDLRLWFIEAHLQGTEDANGKGAVSHSKHATK
jgi:starvation-inducible DNA-binding protein